MDNTEDLRLLLASRYPLIVAEMQEEPRFLGILEKAASSLGLPVWVWSASRGLARRGEEPQYGTVDPGQALAFAADLGSPAVFVFADVRPALDNPVFVRRLKEFAQSNRCRQTAVLTGARVPVPPELHGLAMTWRLKPPSREELESLVRRSLDDLAVRGLPVRLDASGVAALVDALRGLTVTEADHLIQQAALKDGSVTVEDVAYVRDRKADLLERSDAIELIEADHGTLDDVGGLDRLKEWLRLRGRAFEPAAAAYGLEPPRGALITGVPGCGKSLVAKTLARAWNLPLARLDVSALYGPFVGESEERLRRALAVAEAMAPIVLWIDEIEKAFAAGGAGDGGVSQRILGEFLRWMQERPKGIFVIATSNDVTALPPELLRKGRFDEIFFVDLPDDEARREILRIQLHRRERDPSAFDLEVLADASEGFSGAEIEAAIVGAMYRAYASGLALGTADIIAELHATVPLARTRAEEIARLRAWAAERAVPAASSPARVQLAAG